MTNGGKFGLDSACADHDHASGKLRGLLCSSCNYGIGCLRDSIENLEAAIVYLRRHAESSHDSAYSAQIDADIIYHGPLFENSPPQG